MRHRFVPSYYARDLLNKMQQFQQGSQSVEDYYRELQKDMIRCGILEEPDAAMARFRGGLNCEIQDILDYKKDADMTQLFEFACKAEREVQGRRSRTYSNLLQVETHRPVQHLLSLRHPHLHCVRGQLRRQEPPQPQAQHPPQVVHGISRVFAAADVATWLGTVQTSAHYSFVTMVSTLQLVIQKNLNILCLPLTMQLRRTYMSIPGTLIGTRVLLSNVFLVHRSPQPRRISDTLCSIRRVL
jgi:hypothetical protein